MSCISIVNPVCDAEDCLRECINRVLAQPFPISMPRLWRTKEKIPAEQAYRHTGKPMDGG